MHFLMDKISDNNDRSNLEILHVLILCVRIVLFFLWYDNHNRCTSRQCLDHSFLSTFYLPQLLKELFSRKGILKSFIRTSVLAVDVRPKSISGSTVF